MISVISIIMRKPPRGKCKLRVLTIPKPTGGLWFGAYGGGREPLCVIVRIYFLRAPKNFVHFFMEIRKLKCYDNILDI